MTVYVFDESRHVREMLKPEDTADLIHDENNHQITISISADSQVKTGEYIGFRCVDGHYRMFCVTAAALDDDKRQINVTATDAIIQDAKERIIEPLQLLDVTLDDALSQYAGEGWTVEGEVPDRLEKSRAYYASLWSMITTLEQLYEWKINAYYRFENGAISGRVLGMHKDEPTFRGRILQSGKDASKLYVTSTGRPITRLYGLGKATGSQDEPENLNFADVEWSVENGDPVNKPKGQAWVEDPEAVAEHGIHADTFSAPEAETPADLLKQTWEELQKRKRATVAIKANVADMEMVPGYSHMQIRLGDLVAVVLKDGTIVEAKIIAIKRNYSSPWLTTVTIGEKTATIQTQVAALITSATHTFERLTIHKNRFEEDEALIQLNAEHIQLNATSIIEHARQIMLIAQDTEVVKLDLDGINGTLTAQAGRIQLNADAIEANTQKIDAQADTITLQAQEIALKASKTYVDNLVAQFVTAEELEAEILTVVDSAYIEGKLEAAILSVGGIVAGYVDSDGVTANDVVTAGLSVNGQEFSAHSHAVKVDGGTVTLGEVSSSGGSFNIADTQFYKDGVSAAKDSVTLTSKGWVGGVTVVEASNGKSVNVSLPPFSSSGGDVFSAEHKTTVYFFTSSVPGPLMSVEIDASSVYEAGYKAAKEAVTVQGGITSITNTAANYMMAKGWANAMLDGEQLDYTTFAGSQYFPGLGQ